MESKTRHLFVGAALSLAMGLCPLGCKKESATAGAPPPPRVTVAHPEEREIVDYDQYNGWLAAAETVDVRARVRGHIDKIHFQDGDLVRAGDKLFTLDPRPFQADLDAAAAQLRVYEAQKVAADKELVRVRELLGKGGASQSQVDKAEADAGALQAQIEQAKQAVERERLNLEYSVITSPIAGRIGRALLTVGNLVNAGGSDPLLTTIVSVDPIYVYFNVDERALQRYMRSTEEADPSLREKPLAERKVPFTFGLETDTGYPHQGFLNFADNKVDQETGTIQVRGAIPNPGGRFVAGSRARVRIPVSRPYKALVVPDTALLTDQDRKYLLVVGEKDVVLRQPVRPGKLLDDGQRIILPGDSKERALSAGDWVIVLNLQRARLDYPVEPRDAQGRPVGPPAASPTPSPQAGAGGTAAETKKD